MEWFNILNQPNDRVAPEAFDKVKQLFMTTFPHIAREQTTEEKDKINFYFQNGIDEYL